MSQFDVENKAGDKVGKVNEDNYYLKIFNVSLNALAHWLVGAVTTICLLYAFRNGLPIGATPLHIVLCVIGYQFLMAEAILALSPHNGWSLNLKFVDKRRAHWLLQVVGSGLAIAGSFIKALDKNINWNTLHGQFALVSMVFTVACFFNGITSLYPSKFKFIPPSLSKITHICFGIVAFVTASISLCYGFDKFGFRNWLTPALATTSIAFTAALTAIIIINPIIEFGVKSLNVLRR